MTDPLVAGFFLIVFFLALIFSMLIGVLIREGLKPWKQDEIDNAYASNAKANSIAEDKD